MNASNSGMSVINHKNANQNIKNKANYIIPKTLAQMQLPNHNIRVFYYTDKNKNIIGHIILKKIDVTSPQSLVSIIGGKVVYELSINIISHESQKKGYATDFFGKILHKIINEEDAFIYLIDMTGFRIGEKLYAGPKVIAKFDVYHIFNGERGSYLIGRKTDKNRVHYVKLNKNDPELEFYFARSSDTNSGKMHQKGYLNNNPPNASP
jgi:predicted transcriptional regulator